MLRKTMCFLGIHVNTEIKRDYVFREVIKVCRDCKKEKIIHRAW